MALKSCWVSQYMHAKPTHTHARSVGRSNQFVLRSEVVSGRFSLPPRARPWFVNQEERLGWQLRLFCVSFYWTNGLWVNALSFFKDMQINFELFTDTRWQKFFISRALVDMRTTFLLTCGDTWVRDFGVVSIPQSIISSNISNRIRIPLVFHFGPEPS